MSPYDVIAKMFLLSLVSMTMISYVNLCLTQKNEWAINIKDQVCVFQKQGILHTQGDLKLLTQLLTDGTAFCSIAFFSSSM